MSPSPTKLTEAEVDYALGFIQVGEYNFDSNEQIRDKFNRRWLKCKQCGEIKRADEMISYGGKGSINKGICKSCK